MTTVALIEDDKAMTELMSTVLRGAGHEVVAGVDLVELDGARADVVITDLVTLPTYDATKARVWVALLRQRFPGAPVIVCTAHGEAAGEPDRLGADAVITRPFDVDELAAAVQRLAP